MNLLEEANPKKRYSVLVPYPVEKAFDYGFTFDTGQAVPKLGSYVTVPFGKKTITGVVWSDVGDAKLNDSRLKYIETVHDELPPMSEGHRKFLEFVASYTMSDLGSVLRLSLSVPAVFRPLKRKVKSKEDPKKYDYRSDKIAAVSLTDYQSVAAETVCQSIEHKEFAVSLLDGVTGAGKTETYFKAVEKTLAQGENALILLPEIALTTQIISRFEQHFGFSPVMWHSALTPAQRRKNWERIAKGEGRVVIGARSALFIPFPHLRLIVIDEEHDTAFKQEDGAIYHARDMAVARAKIENMTVVLVSATPTLETYLNATEGKYQHLHLPSRYGAAVMPEIELIDMRGRKMARQSWISDRLLEMLQDRLDKQEQSLLFLNRRGYAPLTLCRSCGHRMKCPNCTAWLVEHRRSNRLQCHHCGYGMQMPSHCPSCGDTDSLAPCGPGVERIADEVRNLFPTARLAIFSSDVMTEPAMMQDTLARIHAHQVDIIVGTQMIAKGHHFPMLTCVGVIDADLGLEGGDLRAGEHTFQLLHQVAGRAGRAERKGQVYLQTFMPDNKVIQALASCDRDAFFAAELEEREMALMPPYGRLISLIISGPDVEQVVAVARALSVTAPRTEDIMVLGPAAAPLAQLRGKYRYRFLLRVPKNIHIQKAIRTWLSAHKIPSNIKVQIDIDPVSFL